MAMHPRMRALHCRCLSRDPLERPDASTVRMEAEAVLVQLGLGLREPESPEPLHEPLEVASTGPERVIFS